MSSAASPSGNERYWNCDSALATATREPLKKSANNSASLANASARSRPKHFAKCVIPPASANSTASSKSSKSPSKHLLQCRFQVTGVNTPLSGIFQPSYCRLQEFPTSGVKGDSRLFWLGIRRNAGNEKLTFNPRPQALLNRFKPLHRAALL